MENFSYVWVFIIFLCQVINLGMCIAKLGDTRIGTYSATDVIFMIVWCIFTGLCLYWWK